MRRNSGPTFADFALSMREAMEELQSIGYRQEYFINSDSRFRPRPPGISASGSGADFHLANEGKALKGIERAYHFDRNNMVIGAAVQRLVDNVLSDIPTVQPLTGDPALNADLSAEFYEWGENPALCDDALEDDLFSQSQQVMRSMIVGGDAIVVGTGDGRLQNFEAYRCRTPRGTVKNVVRGVLLDERRRRKQYWITREEISPLATLAKVGEVNQVPTFDANGERQVFHVLDKKRSSQTRGVSYFAPCVDAIGMHDDIQFATLVKTQMAACWAILEKYVGNGGNLPGVPSRQDDAKASAERTTEKGVTYDEVRPGMIVRAREGLEPVGFAPNIPNAEFFPHVKLILTFIAINLNLPVQALLLEPNANFSAWRGAIDEARKGFSRLQRLLIARYFAPVYRYHLLHRAERDARIARFMEKLGDQFFAVTFLPPKWRYIEPNKDALGDAARKRHMLDAPRRIAAERQLDYVELVREYMEDGELAIRTACTTARKLRKEFPEFSIDWRDLYQPPTVDQVAGKSSDPNAADPPSDPAPSQEPAA